ncbi:ribosomal protein S18-alanine N-acetyltransferase [Pseudomaricurvus alkylphenolicus]|uniref:ribosomal protein S18-alanine N-acetyltransferase n=1 Tax=Pseudomaricurvus alkylphenolicus TaxID=1306991 RepID=UPI0014207CEB|nr:ribosomal protein S18-alanine N-acetyltransferase [Pseudomaricurvus alkylphenolicus]NIB40002.1 ribosomal protein S18-alanine N-acetyltransferase [Pseudomaricurvus alkylphenolicus]
MVDPIASAHALEFNGRTLRLHTLDESALSQLMVLERDAHSHPWSETNMSRSLQRQRVFGLLEGQEIRAFAVFSLVLDEAELLDFVVDPAQQGLGLGGAFLGLCLKQISPPACRVFLEVRQSNEPAIALYLGAGFAEVGIRQNYYPAPNGGREDAILMAMELVD